MDNRIAKYAKFFRALFWFFFIIFPIIVCAIWLSGGTLGMEYEGAEIAIDMFIEELYIEDRFLPEFPLAWDIRLLGLGVSLLPLGIGMLSLWWLIRLFDCFAAGEIFTKNTVMYIRRLGWTMVAGVVATPIYDALLTLVITMHNAPGDRLVYIGLESTDFEELITAGVIILVSWIMDEGRKLREVDELTV